MILRGNVYSDTLKTDVPISYIIPNKFDSTKKYKSAYVLHGLFGDNESWIDNTMLPVYAGFYNTIFIMPNAGRSFYSNMKFGYNYLKFVCEELPQITTSVFNISRDRQDTAIIGGSMGGYGALKCAFSYPEQFGYCTVMAAACLYLRQNLKKDLNNKKFIDSFGIELLKDFKLIFGDNYEVTEKDELLDLAKNINEKNKPVIYSVCGNNDIFLEINKNFTKDMNELNYKFKFEIIDGKHDWFFFDKGIKKCLEFLYKDK